MLGGAEDLFGGMMGGEGEDMGDEMRMLQNLLGGTGNRGTN